MKYLFIILTFISIKAFSQTDEGAIKRVVNKLFEGMKKADTVLIRSAFTAEPLLQTVLRNKEGKSVVRTEPLDSFLVAIGKPHKEVYDERITYDIIRIDGDLAIVWAPYKFFLDDKFSHCGVDSFQLVKINGEWRIQYLIDTRRKQDCE
jgi:hypothetical protein